MTGPSLDNLDTDALWGIMIEHRREIERRHGQDREWFLDDERRILAEIKRREAVNQTQPTTEKEA